MNKETPNNPDSDRPLITHLEALRNTLLWVFGGIAVVFPLCFWAVPMIMELLIKWSCPAELGSLHFFSPMEVFIAELKLALILAIALSFPFSAYKIWHFLLPGLYENERKALSYSIILSSGLFLGGAAFCIGLILPLVMKFAASFASGNLQPTLGLSNFLNLASFLILSFGLMFQTPLIVFLLVKFHLTKVESLKKMRPYIIVILLILAAILTPPDVISQLALFIPTYLLFELGLLLSSQIKNEKSEHDVPPDDDRNMLEFYQQQEDKK